MRQFKASSVLFLFVLVVAATPMLAVTVTTEPTSEVSVNQAPSRVCHPKKPITCRASEFSAVQVALEQTSVADVSSAVTAPQPDAPVSISFENDGRLCFGPRWYCRAPGLI